MRIASALAPRLLNGSSERGGKGQANAYHPLSQKNLLGSLLLSENEPLGDPAEGSLLEAGHNSPVVVSECETLYPGLIIQILPSVDLEIPVNLGNLGLQLILVAGNGKLLSVVGIRVRRVQNEADLGKLHAISRGPLQVVDGPSLHVI